MDLDEAKRNCEDQIILWQQKEFKSINAGSLYYIECRERIEALKEVLESLTEHQDNYDYYVSVGIIDELRDQ